MTRSRTNSIGAVPSSGPLAVPWRDPNAGSMRHEASRNPEPRAPLGMTSVASARRCVDHVACLVALLLGWISPLHAQPRPAVGLSTFTVEAADGDEAFPVTVYYPATGAVGSTREGRFTVPATRDAPAANGPFPLIVISHGSGASPISHWDTAAHLAASGFVVALPRHPRDHEGDTGGVWSDVTLMGRPRQIARAIDTVLARAVPRIDAGRIGLIGFSAGAYAGLVTMGAVPDFDLPRRHCTEAWSPTAFCRNAGRGGIRRERPDWTARSDPRVSAAVLMAPALTILFDRAGLASTRGPLRLYFAEKDEAVSTDIALDHLRRLLPVAPEIVVLPKAGHLVFVAPCPPGLDLPVCRDPPGVDRSAVHRKMNAEIVDFFARAWATR